MTIHPASPSVAVYRSELQTLVFELVACLEQSRKPRLADPQWVADLRGSLDSASVKMHQMRLRYAREIEPQLQARMQSLGTSLEAYRIVFEEKRDALNDMRRDARAKYDALARDYESFLLELKQSGLKDVSRTSHLKPRNYWRNLFHAGNGALGAILYSFFLSKSQALLILGAMLIVVVALELSRKLSSRWNDFLVDRIFGLVSRPKERHTINSASWYLLALVISVAFFSQEAVVTGLLVLGFADPAASLVGKKWGSVKIRGQKSLQGALGFAVTAMVFAGVYAHWAMLPLEAFGFVAYVTCVGAVGTLAELFGDRVDDNFGVMLSVAAMVDLYLWVFGG